MRRKFKTFLKKKALQYSLDHMYEFENATVAYSQEGEDLLLQKLFGQKKDGYFVDVGAHHPKLYSNTYFFYKKGWRGINIDPLPGIMEEFKILRPGDINLEIGISDQPGKLIYHMFDEPALNTFSKEVADMRVNKKHGKLLSTKEIEVKRLDEVLMKNFPENKIIDFLSIDVEGLDLQVLLSNNWEKYRPKVIIAECLNSSIEDLLQGEVYKFMKEKKYIFFAKTVGSVFFIDSFIYKELTGN
ncbi:MAG: FkbM family methyltransferase [Cytophagaceae bacterium]|nr:FkbM family methyltransferase [Cytophagaceae bacterium]